MTDLKSDNAAALSPRLYTADVADEEKRFQEIFEGNRAWVKHTQETAPETFEILSKEQRPRYLFIGCADSRVPYVARLTLYIEWSLTFASTEHKKLLECEQDSFLFIATSPMYKWILL